MTYIPLGNETITLYHLDGGAWTKTILADCSWRQRIVRAIVDGMARLSCETTARIGAPSPAIPAAGDVIVRGECPDNPPASNLQAARLLEKYRENGAFRVQSVADNAQFGLPLAHFAAKGE